MKKCAILLSVVEAPQPHNNNTQGAERQKMNTTENARIYLDGIKNGTISRVTDKFTAPASPKIVFQEEEENPILTGENIQTLGHRIALRAIKTALDKASGKGTEERQEIKSTGRYKAIKSLYDNLCNDINNVGKDGYTTSESYDIAQEAMLFLCDHKGKHLEDPYTTVDNVDKKGNPVTVKRACFRLVTKYVTNYRQHSFKCLYINDFAENGESLVKIPFQWDVDNIKDYSTITEIISSLNLSAKEKEFISYRLRGKTYTQIMGYMGVTESTVKQYAYRIKQKAKNNESLKTLVEKLK